jgi:hypothetical protein
MKWMRTLVLVALAAFALAFTACESDSGGSGDGSTGTPDPDEGTTVTKAVTAADGGSVATDSGNASIAIPAGALADDTEITIEVSAKEADTASSVYDFGPDGQQFQKAVTISLAFDGDAGVDMKAVLGTFDENAKKWKEVPNSALAGGVVTGDVNHFSKYSIIIVDGQIVLTSDCGDLLGDFQACGGDPVGTWKFDAMCFPPETLGANPFAESCPTATAVYEIEWDADIIFSADGSSETIYRALTMATTYDFPMSCLQQGQTCAILAESLESTCEETGGSCVCTASNTDVKDPAEIDKGTWSVDGANLIMTDDEAEVQTNPFCVNGDTLYVKVVEEPDADDPDGVPTEFVAVLKKK